MKSVNDQPAAAAPDTSTGTVSRALQLLSVLADAGESVTVKYVAETMRLAPSTAHRLLNLLKKEGFVEAGETSRQYAIGPQFYRVSARVVSAVSLPALAVPVITEIAKKFDETVMFGMYLPTEYAMSFAARADGNNKLQYQIDMHTPLSLLWGSSGKAILAYLSAADISHVLLKEGRSPASGAQPPDFETLSAELETIRQRGFCVSESEKLPDARGIAAPVFGASGVVGCLVLTSPIVRMPHADVNEIGLEVAAQAKNLSKVFGALSV